MVKAEIITIGDEILIGQVVDTNSGFVGRELTRIGIEVRRIISIEDKKEAVVAALSEAAQYARVVVITGGLGPTKDDVTKLSLCEFFEDTLVEDAATMRQIESLFGRPREAILEINQKQALVPSGAEVLLNKQGTAPGMWFEKEGIVYVCLPGVPFEMEQLVVEEVLPRLIKRFDLSFIFQKNILTYGMGESLLADKIKDWERSLPADMNLAYLPQPGSVQLRLMVRGENQEEMRKTLAVQFNTLKTLIGEYIAGVEGDRNLQEEIADQLKKQHKTLAVSESCTGGRIAALFTALPGASAYFKGGLIPYQTQMKTNILGVPQNIIEQYSVVSAEVAGSMAFHTRKLFDSDIAIATTGNAGPTKGDSDAEIGTVFIALACEEGVETFAFHLGKSRARVVGKAVVQALRIIDKKLAETNS